VEAEEEFNVSDSYLLLGIILFLSACAAMNWAGLPHEYQFVSSESIVTIALTAAGVAAFCSISTGIPCAIALAVAVGANFAVSAGLLFAATSSYPLINILVVNPISFMVNWILYRLARGTGQV